MITTFNLAEISQVAQDILNNLEHKIILFNAEMGSGKTTLIKEILAHLGIEEFEGSPTFSIVNEYNTTTNKAFHFDLYRINEPEELYDIGFEDYLQDDAYVFIEWPEHAITFLDDNVHTITIVVDDNESRTLTMT